MNYRAYVTVAGFIVNVSYQSRGCCRNSSSRWVVRVNVDRGGSCFSYSEWFVIRDSSSTELNETISFFSHYIFRWRFFKSQVSCSWKLETISKFRKFLRRRFLSIISTIEKNNLVGNKVSSNWPKLKIKWNQNKLSYIEFLCVLESSGQGRLIEWKPRRNVSLWQGAEISSITSAYSLGTLSKMSPDYSRKFLVILGVLCKSFWMDILFK